jgi:predicted ester cyclase
VAGDLTRQQKDELLHSARLFYEFWNTGDPATLKAAVSPQFMDRALPAGRPQGPGGPLIAIQNFKKAVPDLRCEVTQQIVVSERVVSHLRFTGHFTGSFARTKGQGQKIDFIATDILRIHRGQIADNWHLEDNLTFLQQIGIVKR